MSVTAGQVAVKLNLDKTQFEQGMQQARKSVDLLSTAFSSIAALGVGATLLNIGQNALKASSDFEQAQVAFGVMLGDAEKASRLVNQLQDMANVTPFETQDLLDASRVLLNFGIQLEDLLPDLQMLGDISGGNREKMRSMTLAFAQMSSAGRLMGQDMLQMVNAGFNPLQQISEETGKSMAVLKKEMEEGKISVEMVQQAFKDAASEGGRFYGMMEQQSKTLEGVTSTMSDAYTLMTRAISDLALPAIKQQVVETTKLIEKTTEHINTLKAWASVNHTVITTTTNTALALATVIAGTTAVAAATTAYIQARHQAITQIVLERQATEALTASKAKLQAAEMANVASFNAVRAASIANTQALAQQTVAENALASAQARLVAAESTGNAATIANAQASVTAATAEYNRARAIAQTTTAQLAKVTAEKASTTATLSSARAEVVKKEAILASNKASVAQLLCVGRVGAALKALIVSIRATTVALLECPLTWVALAIGAVSAAIFSYKNNVEQTTAAIKDLNNKQIQSVDETQKYISTLQELQGVQNLDLEQKDRLDNAIAGLKEKYPQYAAQIENEIKLQGRLSETLARKIALMEMEAQLKNIDLEIAKNEKMRNGFHPISNFKYAISLGKMDEYQLADDNLDKLYQERIKTIQRYENTVNSLTKAPETPTKKATSNNTGETKTAKQLAAEEKARRKEALAYKLGLLEVEKYQTQRTEDEIYQINLKQAEAKIAAAKAGTSEYAQALAQKLQLEREYEQKQKALKSQKVVDDLTNAKQSIDNQMAMLELEYDRRKISKTQLLELEINFINQKKKLEETALQEQLKLVEGNTAEEVKIKRASQKIMEDYNIQANRKALELWNYQHQEIKGFADDFASEWGNALSGLINGEMTFADAANSLFNNILSSFGDMCGEMVTRWIKDNMALITSTKAFTTVKLWCDNLLHLSNSKTIASNTLVASSAATSAAATTSSAAATSSAMVGLGTAVSVVVNPIMKLAGAMAALAASSGVVALSMPVIALSTAVTAASAALAALSMGILNTALMMTSPIAMMFSPISVMLAAEMGVVASAATTAAAAVGKLAVSLAAASAAAIPFVGWAIAPAAAMATGAGIMAGQMLAASAVQFREKGGEVKKGQAYIVGEKRPELFIPDRDGRIEPNLNSLNGTNQSQTHNSYSTTVVIQAIDTKDFKQRVGDLTEYIHGNIQKGVKKRQLAPLGG